MTEDSCDVSSSILVTGGDDFCLKLWSIDDGLEAQGHCLQTLQAHEGPINCIGTAHGPQGTTPKRVVFASGAADATIKIWSLEGRTMIRLQTVETQPKFFPLSLALRRLDDDWTSFVLAAAGTRDTIQIYTSVDGPEGLEFTLQATQQGHEGWIRSLDFTSDGNDILLASASQDKYIRIWRVHRGKELPAQRPTGGDNSMGTFLSGSSPSIKARWIKAGASGFSITFEALPFGHDGRHGWAHGELAAMELRRAERPVDPGHRRLGPHQGCDGQHVVTRGSVPPLDELGPDDAPARRVAHPLVRRRRHLARDGAAADPRLRPQLHRGAGRLALRLGRRREAHARLHRAPGRGRDAGAPDGPPRARGAARGHARRCQHARARPFQQGHRRRRRRGRGGRGRAPPGGGRWGGPGPGLRSAPVGPRLRTPAVRGEPVAVHAVARGGDALRPRVRDQLPGR